ncbi:hypothetical protein [Nocardia fluminea]|uniref:hypothetical protein n=1 Tax=Nocardia fluminea TaxID=134984 RepID=UPI00343C450A
MALDIIVQNMNHEEKFRVSDDPQQTLYLLCEAQPRDRIVRGIYRDGDTMFNTWQLKLLLEQTEDIQVEDAAQRAALDQLRHLSNLAIRANGYLMFIGD